MSVPIRFPATTLPVVPASVMSTPSSSFPEMRLPAATAVPPIVLLHAPAPISTPMEFRSAKSSGDVGADQVALDDVARSARPRDLHPVDRVAGDHVARAGSRPADNVARGTGRDQDSGAVGQRGLPVISVPIKLPLTTFALAPAPIDLETDITVSSFPEMRLPAAATVPPTVLADAPPPMNTP